MLSFPKQDEDFYDDSGKILERESFENVFKIQMDYQRMRQLTQIQAEEILYREAMKAWAFGK